VIAPLAVRTPLIVDAVPIASAIAKLRLPDDIDETLHGVLPVEAPEARMAE
jgi:hypothetical protein